MIIHVQRLDARSRGALYEHLLALSPEDRRLRFGSSLSAAGINEYVDRIDFQRDAVFGVHDMSLVLVGAVHLALPDAHAELGLSVLSGHRGRGVGSALFERAAAHARNRSVPRLYMHCLRENLAVVHIARKFEMDIVAEAGEADAHLALPPASPVSIAGEVVTDRLALYDYAVKSEVATWKGVNAALTGTRSTR
jgi:GNAT superfamily N-acetyltransferase